MLYGLTVFWISLALICYWLGWRVRPHSFRARGGALLSVVGVLLCLVAFALRAGAKVRLRQQGITPHPLLKSPMGLAVGLGRGDKTWVFYISKHENSALEFYLDSGNLSGWELSAHDARNITFKRPGQHLTISHSEKSLIYMMRPR